MGERHWGGAAPGIASEGRLLNIWESGENSFSCRKLNLATVEVFSPQRSATTLSQGSFVLAVFREGSRVTSSRNTGGREDGHVDIRGWL